MIFFLKFLLEWSLFVYSIYVNKVEKCLLVNFKKFNVFIFFKNVEG